MIDNILTCISRFEVVIQITTPAAMLSKHGVASRCLPPIVKRATSIQRFSRSVNIHATSRHFERPCVSPRALYALSNRGCWRCHTGAKPGGHNCPMYLQHICGQQLCGLAKLVVDRRGGGRMSG